jgi:hypothetical protein
VFACGLQSENSSTNPSSHSSPVRQNPELRLVHALLWN